MTDAMDFLECGSPARCAECHHFVGGACALALALEDALPGLRPAAPALAPAPGGFAHARGSETWQSVLLA